MTPEAIVKKHVVAILMKYNAWYCFPVAGPYTKKGVPDILACWHGIFLAIETKATKNEKPSKLQQYVHDQIRTAGGAVFIVNSDNIENLEEWFYERQKVWQTD